MRKLISIVIIFLLGVGATWWWFNQSEQGIQVDMTRRSIITRLEKIERLETAKMTIEKTIEGKSELGDFLPNTSLDNLLQNFLFEDVLTITAQAEVTAGFDLSTLTGDWVMIDENGSAVIQLPPAQVINTTLTEITTPIERQLGLLTKGDEKLETEVRNQTINILKQEAIDGGLLQQAEANALEVFRELFGAAGIEISDIIIVVDSLQ